MMTPFAQTILTFSAAVTAVALVLTTFQLKALRDFLSSNKIKVEVFYPVSSPSIGLGLMASPAGYAIYVFRQGQWVLESDLSNPGHEAVPPSIPGSYEGQVVKKEAGMKGAV